MEKAGVTKTKKKSNEKKTEKMWKKNQMNRDDNIGAGAG